MKPSSSLCIKGSDYMTVHSAPPKHPSGRIKFRETRHPIYRGVRRRGTSNRWVCEVRNPNNKSRIWLWTFATADMAARAHDVAAMALCGRSACLNFADSAWLTKLPNSFSSVKDIKKAAIEAAENFKCKDVLPSPSSASSSSSSSSSSHQSSVEIIEEIISMAIEKTVDLEIISMSIAKTVNLEIVSMAIEKTVNLEMDYDIELNMDLGSYYTNLAEGTVSPANWFDDLDDNNWGSPMSLWS